MSGLAIRAEGLGKRYRLKTETVWALREVSFEVRQGEVMGMIGRNGAGKSTLLKILSRIVEPTEGRVGLKGRVTSLLEVGTGFHRELTGRENIYLNGSLLGMKKREVDAKIDQIVAFAEIDRYIDSPVKYYSSGMYIRLAFAVAAHVEPDVLLVDEVLAVGDLAFQKKCLGKVKTLGGEGRTVIFVTHDTTTIRQLCPTSIWLDKGHIVGRGTTEDVLLRYTEATAARRVKPSLRDFKGRRGSGAARLVDHWVEGATGAPSQVVISGQDVAFVFEIETLPGQPLQGARLSLHLQDLWDKSVLVLNNQAMGQDLGPLVGAGRVRCLIPRFPLAGGTYKLRAQLFADDGTRLADEIDHLGDLHVVDGDFYGVGTALAGEKSPYLVDAVWSTAASNVEAA